MKISIVFATYKNEKILEKSLNAYSKITTEHCWELIIVDNACRDETRLVIEKFKKTLPIIFVEKSEPGKNNALNKALPLIKGELVMFTDNDILPKPDIIDVYVNAASTNPDTCIFGGKILPDITLPAWIDTDIFSIQTAFGILDAGDKNKAIPPEDVWGGNMMMRSELFNQNLQFNSTVGPNGENYIMGSETELLLRLNKMGFAALYVANAIVWHQIRSEQLTMEWLAKRAYRAGRGGSFNSTDSSKRLFGFPRYLIRQLAVNVGKLIMSLATFNKAKINIATMRVFNCLGRLSHYVEN